MPRVLNWSGRVLRRLVSACTTPRRCQGVYLRREVPLGGYAPVPYGPVVLAEGGPGAHSLPGGPAISVEGVVGGLHWRRFGRCGSGWPRSRSSLTKPKKASCLVSSMGSSSTVRIAKSFDVPARENPTAAATHGESRRLRRLARIRRLRRLSENPAAVAARMNPAAVPRALLPSPVRLVAGAFDSANSPPLNNAFALRGFEHRAAPCIDNLRRPRAQVLATRVVNVVVVCPQKCTDHRRATTSVRR